MRQYLKDIGNRLKGAATRSGSATPGTTRRLSIVSVDVFGQKLLFESLIDPWGEDDPILTEIVDSNRYEPRSLNFWAFVVQSADPGSIFLDVGAYTGFYAVLTGRLCNAGKVVAIEPAAATFGRLLRNICLNSLDYCIVPANLAAASSDGFMTLTHRYGIYTLCPGESLSADDGDHSELCTAIRLDRLTELSGPTPHFLNSKAANLMPISSVAGIKIDVEGAELEVLKGSKKLIGAFKPIILAEFLSDRAKDELLAFGKSVDYVPYELPAERNIALLPASRMQEIIDLYKNWCAKHGDICVLDAKRVVDFPVSEFHSLRSST